MGDQFFTSIFPDIPKELLFDGLDITHIEKVKFKKKSNILELTMLITNSFNLALLAQLEKYIIDKLKLRELNISMKYIGCQQNMSSINVDQVLKYLLYKHPSIKGIFNNYDYTYDKDNISIKLTVKAKEMLENKKMNKIIEELIFNNYGIKSKINFIDGESKEYDLEMENKIVQEKIKDIAKKDLKEESKNKNFSIQNSDNVFGKAKIKETLQRISDLTVDSGRVSIEGDIIKVDSRELKSGKVLVIFNVYDGTTTMAIKTFVTAEESKAVISAISSAERIRVEGNVQYDPYAKELGVIANVGVKVAPKPKRMDLSSEKRVELHLHTKMSAMDGISSATDIIKTAARWGHKAIAITDHGVVQAFPEAHIAAKEFGIKVIYGVEGYVVYDDKFAKSEDNTYMVLDIETTGLNKETDCITEIGIAKLVNGEIVEEFNELVNPQIHIPENITELTGITDEMVKDALTIDEILPKVIEFVGNFPIVAHNASFDMGFIKYNAEKLGLQVNNDVIDTLQIAREKYPDFPNHKLGTVADNLDIIIEKEHRAIDDVKTLVKVFNIMEKDNQQPDEENMNKHERYKSDIKKGVSYHITILVKNYTGLKNLYKLISNSHVEYFHKRPRIPMSELRKYKKGLIVGSACEQGKIYKAIQENIPEKELLELAKDYDYFEIMPDGNNSFMIRDGIVNSIEDLHEINRKIIALAEKCNKLVVATGDVHFLNPEDEIYRRVLQAGQGYSDADFQAPLYLKTTDEILDDFTYLDKDKAYEYAVTNTNKIADMCEVIQPVPDGTYPPRIKGSDEEIERIAYKKAHEIYGEVLPDIVKNRLEKELNSIIKHGFSIMYIIAQKLVAKSNADGYLVGSRGSVGSSFAATMTGITEVNPLPPHYVCPNCKNSDFEITGYKCGFDLPDKNCQNCGTKYNKNGIDIPFETFLGFDGDKAPDIDLNFSGDYQKEAHKYTEELFGIGKVFKAGTIGTMQEKTALGFVRKYYEEKNIYVSNAETTRIAQGCVGIKRTTGQHPGGMIVIPDYKDVYDFCPIQYPADDDDDGNNFKTTHFDFHSIHDNVLKLDILGHDDPTVIKMLEELTGINIYDVPLDDKETMSLFSSTEALGVKPDQIGSEVGSFAVPEFGTKFVRQMLVDTKPSTFEELLRISGLSHGTDVWLNNAQTLIAEGIAPLSETICTRDDIMLYLLKMNLPPKLAFKTMESVRKGKGLSEEMEQSMQEHNVPSWYIKSCKQIKYMFPKAHAAAYVTNAFRIAWFKVHKPKAFYTAYFTIRADDFDANIMIKGKDIVKQKIKELENQGNNISVKDKSVLTILEVVNEMYERGIKFLPISLKNSHATKFKVEEDGIRPSLNTLPGLGTIAAQGIYNAVQNSNGDLTVDDLQVKAKIGKSTIQILEGEGCLDGMMRSNQYSFF